jgi:hypothetical protein
LSADASSVNHALMLLIEKGSVEKTRAMDGRRSGPGFRLTREGADPLSQSMQSDNSVQLDKRRSPRGPDGHR